jgi:hypothetical protein
LQKLVFLLSKELGVIPIWTSPNFTALIVCDSILTGTYRNSSFFTKSSKVSATGRLLLLFLGSSTAPI